MSARDIDSAVLQHLAHPAMAGGDPLTDSMSDQLDACAAEGAQPAIPYADSQPQPEHPGWWVAAVALLALLGAACFLPGA